MLRIFNLKTLHNRNSRCCQKCLRLLPKGNRMVFLYGKINDDYFFRSYLCIGCNESLGADPERELALEAIIRDYSSLKKEEEHAQQYYSEPEVPF